MGARKPPATPEGVLASAPPPAPPARKAAAPPGPHVLSFRAKLRASIEGKGWTFATLPKGASARLGARGRVPVRGAINGQPFRGSAFPDGEGGHVLQVNRNMKQVAGVGAGDMASFTLARATDEVAGAPREAHRKPRPPRPQDGLTRRG